MEQLNNSQLMELTEEELIEIDGGHPAVWFAIGLAVGAMLIK